VLEWQHVRASAELRGQAAGVVAARVIFDQLEECVAEVRGHRGHVLEIVARVVQAPAVPPKHSTVNSSVGAPTAMKMPWATAV